MNPTSIVWRNLPGLKQRWQCDFVTDLLRTGKILHDSTRFCTILSESTCVLGKFVIQYPCSKDSSFLLGYAVTRWLRVTAFYYKRNDRQFQFCGFPIVLYHTGLIKSILFLIFFKIAIDKINNRAIIGTVVDTNNQRKEAIP